MTCSVYQSPWLRMMSNRTGENAMKCNSSIQLYSTKKQTVSRNWNRTSSIDHLIHSRTSRKNTGGMKEQEGETGKRGVRRRREKPQLLWESWRLLLTCVLWEGGLAARMFRVLLVSPGWVRGLGTRPRTTAPTQSILGSHGGGNRGGENREEEARQGLPTAPLPLCV